MMPLFSIITICYNSEKTIKRTLDSVFIQSFTDYEYIIVDGDSKDDTPSIIANNESRFNDKGIEYRYISSKDKGVYDAMNKGVSMAQGLWVCFLNAGDFFYNTDTLNEIKKIVYTKSEVDVIFGIIDVWRLVLIAQCQFPSRRRCLGIRFAECHIVPVTIQIILQASIHFVDARWPS